MSTPLTQARLMELLNYDPDTGAFTWSSRHCRKVRVGKAAGTKSRAGYVYIRVDTVRYSAHRLAVLYMKGAWPTEEVDHMNGDRADNRWENLRECTHAENHQNRGKPSVRSSAPCKQSGLLGVTWHKQRAKWRAALTVGSRQKHLGLFCNPEDAHKAYLDAKSRLHYFQPSPRILNG